MRKVIASINITLDGFCDHTAGVPDEELHDHFTGALNDAGVLLYGRTTYQLMEDYWPAIAKQPSGNRSADDFAVAIDKIQKIVFSRTMKDLEWKTASVARGRLKDVVLDLKKESGKSIFIGSPSLIAQCTKLNLIDEYQLCIHPVIIGAGLPLFKGIDARKVFKLLKTKPFRSGVVLHYYEPSNL